MPISFEPPLDPFLHGRAGRAITVLSGANNSGKSLVLKHLKQILGRSAYMVGANRFYHVYHFQSALRDPNELEQLETQFQTQFGNLQFNYEQNFIDLQRIIVGLNDDQRAQLFELCGDLLDSEIEMKLTDDANELSMRYIEMDGQNLAVSSTGARLLMTILGICMDQRFTTLLIDEPELGLSPRVQAAFARFLEDLEARRRNFPHLERVVLATHSHIFLARREIHDNFVVKKDDDVVTLTQVNTVADFHRLQFNLLGNSLEALSLPAAIVVVEGITDHAYLDRVIQLQLPDRRITVVPSQGDVKRVVHGLRSTLGDLTTTPFRTRLFVVLDQVHQQGLESELADMGVLPANVVSWTRNGIEHLYPQALMAAIFRCEPERLDSLTIDRSVITLGDVTQTKTGLSQEILSRIDGVTPLPSELTSRLLAPLQGAIE